MRDRRENWRMRRLKSLKTQSRRYLSRVEMFQMSLPAFSRIFIDSRSDFDYSKKASNPYFQSPNSIVFKKKNIVRPFEDASSLEFFSKKTDSSLIGFGSHNKKRPHNFVIARTFDYQILDMVELGIGNYVPLQ